MPRPLRRIVLLTFPHGQLLDVAGPLQAFATANSIAGGGAYELHVVSRAGGAAATTSGLPIVTERLSALGRAPVDTLIVTGGRPGIHAAAKDASLVAWVARQSKAARRTCSVCTGTFLLAAAGLLDGRRATTHWASCARLQERYPAIKVERDPIFVRDGRIWTSAGITAGIDLALALIQDDLGREVAMRTAQDLVVFLKRPGGQSQFSAPLAAQMADDSFAELQAWMTENIGRDLRVENLAARVGMSPRNFARVYTAKTGTTPAKAVEELRVEAARRMLEENGRPIKAVARAAGFGDEERLRRAFMRNVGVSPLQYRSRFSSTREQHPSTSWV